MTPAERDECRAVDALLAVASGGAVDGEGLRLAADHGVTAESLTAYRSLARARGLDLDQVLRASYRGELLEVVRRPEVRTPRTST